MKNKKLLFVMSAIVCMFLSLILYLAYFQLVEAEKLVDHAYNSRKWVDERKFLRGNIYDRNGTALTENKKNENGDFVRNYVYGSLFSHVVGYNSVDYGKTGLEKAYNTDLLNITEKTPIDGLKNLVIENSNGNDLITSLDVDLQSKANELLTGHKGSIILMNPKTGEIYSMISNPNFNPNTLSKDWESLVNNHDSPLLNRSTQGVYIPGSVIKVVTGASILESGIDLNYNDEGKTVVEGYTINNFEYMSHGEINLMWALVHSSNTYFVDKGLEVGGGKLQETFERFMFNKVIPFELPIEMSSVPFKANMGESALAAAAYGQGTSLVTPLSMAMVSSAIANDGKMVKPIIVNKIIDSKGKVIKEVKTELLSQATSPEVANELKKDMEEVVNNYATAETKMMASAGKTGTAETVNDSTHAWYIGFGPVEDPKFAVAVILEEDGTLGGKTAAPIGAAMLDEAYRVIK